MLCVIHTFHTEGDSPFFLCQYNRVLRCTLHEGDLELAPSHASKHLLEFKYVRPYYRTTSSEGHDGGTTMLPSPEQTRPPIIYPHHLSRLLSRTLRAHAPPSTNNLAACHHQ